MKAGSSRQHDLLPVPAAWLLPITITALYLAFLTRTYYWDGVLFALDIEAVHQGTMAPAGLFHPNHLLYSALGSVLYSAVLALRLNVRALSVLQVFNVFLSVLTGYLVYLLSRRLTQCRVIAIFCWLLFAVGATWWKFSTDADSYVVSVLLVVLVAWFLLETPQRIFAAAGCHIAAMLFHELAIFTYVPVITIIALDSQRSVARRFWMSVAYLAGTGSAVGAVYLLCYTQVDRTAFPSLFRWITSYASDSGFTHSLGQIVGSYLTSYVKLFLGGRLGFIGDYFSVAICLSLLACVSALVWAIILFRGRPQLDASVRINRNAVIFLWVWLISYAIFLASWDPGSAFHKLFVWPPIALLIGVYLAQRDALLARAKAFVAIAVAIAGWNFAAFIYPHSHASADPVLTLAQTIDKELPKTATVYFRVLDPDDWYLEYFAPGRFWSPIQTQGGRAYIGFTNSPAGPVCFETTALALLENAPEFHSDIDPNRRWDLVNSKHNVRLECLKERRWRLTRPGFGRPAHSPQ